MFSGSERWRMVDEKRPMGSHSHLPRVPAIGAAVCHRCKLSHALIRYSAALTVAMAHLTSPHLLRNGGGQQGESCSWPNGGTETEKPFLSF